MSTQAQTASQAKTTGQGPLKNIDAFIFDVFGTVVDWRTNVVKEVQELGKKHGVDPETVNWRQFAQEWRNAYMESVLNIGGGKATSVSYNIDVVHRQASSPLSLLTKPEWTTVTSSWTEEDKRELTLAWHRLSGWPDSEKWLNELKKDKIIVGLSNGNMSLLIDMARHARLPWDAIFSTELFDTFKPNPRAYLETARHLSLPTERCAMVAAHIWDLRAAAKLGLTTIYVPRPHEDAGVGPGDVKPKSEGGEVDYVVDSFEGIVKLVRGA
ncbi:(S)-2-haloacid dehalogenase 4A [Leucoagaricus sp. SymC.cos]|nr:(S)-2-haloacid dehalogenase 4A [Leucoagaricus sp. SymC.cos]